MRSYMKKLDFKQMGRRHFFSECSELRHAHACKVLSCEILRKKNSFYYAGAHSKEGWEKINNFVDDKLLSQDGEIAKTHVC